LVRFFPKSRKTPGNPPNYPEKCRFVSVRYLHVLAMFDRGKRIDCWGHCCLVVNGKKRQGCTSNDRGVTASGGEWHVGLECLTGLTTAGPDLWQMGFPRFPQTRLEMTVSKRV
jgi:hypothetical protein